MIKTKEEIYIIDFDYIKINSILFTKKVIPCECSVVNCDGIGKFHGHCCHSHNAILKKGLYDGSKVVITYRNYMKCYIEGEDKNLFVKILAERLKLQYPDASIKYTVE